MEEKNVQGLDETDTKTVLDCKVHYRPERPKFWATAEDLNGIVEYAERGEWDFSTALGDTISEKYESLYLAVNRITEVMVSSGVAGYFWIAASPEVASIFETAKAGFVPTPRERWEHIVDDFFTDQSPLGLGKVQDVGTVRSRWRLIKCDALPKNALIIGANNRKEDIKNYVVLYVKNFIW